MRGASRTYHEGWARVPDGRIGCINRNEQFGDIVRIKFLDGEIKPYAQRELESVLDDDLDKAGVPYRDQDGFWS